ADAGERGGERGVVVGGADAGHDVHLARRSDGVTGAAEGDGDRAAAAAALALRHGLEGGELGADGGDQQEGDAAGQEVDEGDEVERGVDGAAGAALRELGDGGHAGWTTGALRGSAAGTGYDAGMDTVKDRVFVVTGG